MDITIIPHILALTIIVFQLFAMHLSIRVSKNLGWGLFNGFNLAMAITLLRRLLDYGITLNLFGSYTSQIRYIELGYFPIAFSLLIILGLMRAENINKALIRNIK